MIKVGIIGASGYTGAELTRILCLHPEVEITLATSRKFADRPLSEVFPHLRGKSAIRCENSTPQEWIKKADFFFTAVPHKTAMDIVPLLLNAGKKVIDLSADYRIRDVAVYEQWYQGHSSAEFLDQAVYGLPELYREQIKKAQLVANPGCYPTSIILGLAPLLEARRIQANSIIADSKSGTTGAGRSTNLGSLFCEVHDGFRPYKVGREHRHIPEIEQELTLLAKEQVHITFTPHLLAIGRGILSTIYAQKTLDLHVENLQKLYEDYYQNEPFIRILPEGELPATQYVRGSNYCDLAINCDLLTKRVIITTAIDNIVKGASGQAVQNMNIMCRFREQTGLDGVPYFP